MADRYQDRPFPSADHDRGAIRSARESDPLAELARLIGQTDPFGAAAKPAPHPLQSRANVRPQPYDPPDEDERRSCRARRHGCSARATKPRRRRRAAAAGIRRRAGVRAGAGASLASLRGPAAAGARSQRSHQAPAEQDYHEAPQQYADEPQQDPSRYDDALYGRIETGEHDYQRDPAYPDDPYAYQDEYEEEPAPKKRSSGLMTVAAVLALAVVGTGAAFAYRTYVGSPRSGEPPIIRADNSPTKVVPAPSDAQRQDP